MRRITVIGVLALLLQFDGQASAQSLTLVSPRVIDAGTTLWVSVQLRKAVQIKVETLSGTDAVGDALLFSDPGTYTRPVTLKRAIPAQGKLEIRYSPPDPSFVTRFGASTGRYPDGTAFNTSIEAVHCDGAMCHVCYELQDDSNVDFDSYRDGKPAAVRNDFDNGRRSRGKREANWDQKADGNRPLDPGPYFVRLEATSSSAPSKTSVSSFFLLPAVPPSAARCQ